MFLFLLSLIIAAILVANPRIRNRTAPGAWTRSGIVTRGFPIAKGRAEQWQNTNPMKQFLVVVLPDGTIVTPRALGRF
jgi:hypothetical protein